MRHFRAFSLVEMLVTVAVFAIVAAVAVPAFTDISRNVRASADISRITGALSFARSEAIKRNRLACVQTGNWTSGWSVKISSGSTDVTCASVSAETVRVFDGLSSGASLSVTQAGTSVTSIVFNGAGQRHGGEFIAQYRSRAGECKPSYDRKITIGPTGRALIEGCTP